MNRAVTFILLLPFTVFYVACSTDHSGSASRKQGEALPLPEGGIIHEKIPCLHHPELSYALYVPLSLTTPGHNDTSSVAGHPLQINGDGTRVTWPLLLAFDPQGNGAVPVTLYRELAEKYGFILLGSNDSKNGLSQEQISHILSGMFEEIHTRFPVDTSHLYVMGFSGGARVAVLAAMMYSGVKSVIGCGAGFPQGSQPPLYKFDYFGFIGAADFNLNEMMELDEMLNIMKMRHLIATFNGGHAWPPAKNMEDAVQWNLLNAMKDRRSIKNELQIRQILDSFNERIDSARKENRLIEAASLCREASQFAAGLASIEVFDKKLHRMEQLPGYKKQMARHQNILKKEGVEQQELMGALFTKDRSWWNNRIGKLTNKTPDSDPEDTLMHARLRAFLSLLCYSNVNAAMAQQNYDMAKKLIQIYELADPSNPEPHYIYAKLLMRNNDTTSAIGQLQEAVSKGFSDKNRLLSEPEFDGIKNIPAFFDLSGKMK